LASKAETAELCGALMEAGNPRSPRCVLEKATHPALVHRAVRRDGSIIEWGTTPPATPKRAK